jgi:uncharacterized membrane protein
MKFFCCKIALKIAFYANTTARRRINAKRGRNDEEELVVMVVSIVVAVVVIVVPSFVVVASASQRTKSKLCAIYGQPNRKQQQVHLLGAGVVVA